MLETSKSKCIKLIFALNTLKLYDMKESWKYLKHFGVIKNSILLKIIQTRTSRRIIIPRVVGGGRSVVAVVVCSTVGLMQGCMMGPVMVGGRRTAR